MRFLSDSQVAIKCVNTKSKCVRTYRKAINRLSLEITVNITSVPSHREVEDNEKADELFLATGEDITNNCLGLFSAFKCSVNHIGMATAISTTYCHFDH